MSTDITTQQLNEKIAADPQALIKESEAALMAEIEKTADAIIASAAQKPLIFISGPSGSGKTTTAVKMRQVLQAKGYPVCYISMDRYLKTFTEEERRLKLRKKIDLESPERLDMDFLRQELQALVAGERIRLPEYDFSTNTRTLTDQWICRDGGFIIVEGIHALNPDILDGDEANTNRVYVSVRTRVIDSAGNKLHPCKIRLLRRMLRDKLFRARSAEQTVVMFPSVQYGEKRYILPYKYRANYHIDTFLSYEPALYRADLPELKRLSAQYADIRDAVEALDELLPMQNEGIPSDALIREFIGGSSLQY